MFKISLIPPKPDDGWMEILFLYIAHLDLTCTITQIKK